MDLLGVLVLVILLGLLTRRWVKDSTPGMPDGYRRHRL